MLLVQNGTSSGMTALPSQLLATPAPSWSATAITSSVAPRQPWPTSIATFPPAFRTAAAASRSRNCGTTCALTWPCATELMA